ncbi:MAG TPA: PilZ domain-containing protein [Polyangiaceae bacterium]|nr:PilZ domain-containing protein [Polyangiaceae bacterium]
MADERAVKLAQSAREQLGSALELLQTDRVPLSAADIAAHVAKSMGLLVKFEQGGDATVSRAALLDVRAALGVLQTCSPRTELVDDATQRVAAALGLIHSVTEIAALPAPAALAAPTPGSRSTTQIGYRVPASPNPDENDTYREPLSAPGNRLAARQNVASGSSSGEVRAAEPKPQAAQVVEAPAPNPKPTNPQPLDSAHAEPTLDLRRRVERPATEIVEAPARLSHAPRPQIPEAVAKPSNSVRPRPSSAPRGTRPIEPRVEVFLGANSASNFYVGLGKRSVLEGGGLFVATYHLISVGHTVHLTVGLPGGHEFSAEGVVSWQRDPSRQTTPGVSPGYGVKLKSLSDGAKKLVERYVSNREPLFFEDG